MKPTYSFLQIGINSYGGGAALNGCLNDVKNLDEAVIAERGFSVVYHRAVTERLATAAGMRAALAQAVNQHADRVLVHFSGHGTYLPDNNRDEMFSRYDQAIVPHDYENAGMLIDDELAAYADAVPASATLIYWLDSCHSGGATRGFGLALRNKAKRFLFQSSARALPQSLVTMNARLATYVAQSQRSFKARSKLRIGNNSKRLNVRSQHVQINYTDERHIVIATARANETAADAMVNGQWQGAGTAALLWAWNQLGDKANYEEVSEQANVWLDDNGYSQRIVIEGRIDNLKRPFLT